MCYDKHGTVLMRVVDNCEQCAWFNQSQFVIVVSSSFHEFESSFKNITRTKIILITINLAMALKLSCSCCSIKRLWLHDIIDIIHFVNCC